MCRFSNLLTQQTIIPNFIVPVLIVMAAFHPSIHLELQPSTMAMLLYYPHKLLRFLKRFAHIIILFFFFAENGNEWQVVTIIFLNTHVLKMLVLFLGEHLLSFGTWSVICHMQLMLESWFLIVYAGMVLPSRACLDQGEIVFT